MNKIPDKTFDHLEIVGPQIRDLHYLSERGLSGQTIRYFLPFIRMVRTLYPDRPNMANIKGVGFPYRATGSGLLQGFEVVNYGFSGYFGFTGGRDKAKGAWVAELFPKGVRAVQVFIGGSAMELMSFFELNKHKQNFDQAVFVSAGKVFSDNQIRNILEQYPCAKINTVFGPDTSGKLLDIRVAAIQQELDLSIAKDQDELTFRIDKKHFTLPCSKLRLSRFYHASGVRPAVRAHKAKGRNFNADLRDIRKSNRRGKAERPGDKTVRYI